jgi:hypothetical protein
MRLGRSRSSWTMRRSRSKTSRAPRHSGDAPPGPRATARRRRVRSWRAAAAQSTQVHPVARGLRLARAAGRRADNVLRANFADSTLRLACALVERRGAQFTHQEARYCSFVPAEDAGGSIPARLAHTGTVAMWAPSRPLSRRSCKLPYLLAFILSLALSSPQLNAADAESTDDSGAQPIIVQFRAPGVATSGRQTAPTPHRRAMGAATRGPLNSPPAACRY